MIRRRAYAGRPRLLSGAGSTPWKSFQSLDNIPGKSYVRAVFREYLDYQGLASALIASGGGRSEGEIRVLVSTRRPLPRTELALMRA